MDNPIRVAVMGCNGRMGKVLLEAIANAEGVVVGAALERPGSAVIGLDAGELNGLGRLGVIISDSLEKVKDELLHPPRGDPGEPRLCTGAWQADGDRHHRL